MSFTRIVDRISDIAGAIGALLILPLIGAMFYEVVSRYFFNSPTFWASEIGYMLMGSIYLFGMGYTLKAGGHVSVDIIYAALPRRAKAIARIAGYIMFLPVVCWLSFELFSYAIEGLYNGQTTGKSSWNPVEWPFRMVWSIGFLVLSLQVLVELAKATTVILERKPDGEPS